MSPQSVTESAILRVKEGVDLVNSKDSPEKKAFDQSIAMLKTQQGFLRQSYGHSIEDPTLFVWYIDWEAYESHTAFSQSEEYGPFIAATQQAFDYDAATPLLLHTRFSPTSDPASALKAPVNEIAFFSLPSGSGDDIKSAIEEKMSPIGDYVKSVGKSWGSAVGWLVDPAPPKGDAEGDVIALHGIYGYESVEAHMKWRDQPEHAQAIAIMVDLEKNYGLRPVNGHGLKMFHVKFHTEA